MKKRLAPLLCVLVFALGLAVMFYPTVSNWLHAQSASYAVSNYFESAGNQTNLEYEAEFQAARAYNATLTGNVASFLDAQYQSDINYENPDYWGTLDQIDGIMGVIEIPSINVTLPIYHGTDEAVLQKGAGHLEGSALPTGDLGNHTVITGHTGLPTATLFTDLDELALGDQFSLDVLDQVFTYEIVDIFVVLPSETDQLVAQPGRDLVTLVTCTPYGVNSHRLLIQGERVEEESPVQEIVQEEVLVSGDEDTSQSPAELPTLILVSVSFALLFLTTAVILAVRDYRKKS